MLFDPKWEAPVTGKTPEPWRDALLKAAELIEQRGWCQDFLENSRGQVCALGAMDMLEHSMEFDWMRSLMALEIEIGSASIADWNDNPSRTQAEVLAAFRAAANSGQFDAAS